MDVYVHKSSCFTSSNCPLSFVGLNMYHVEKLLPFIDVFCTFMSHDNCFWNTHAHYASRQCADYARASYAGAVSQGVRGTCYVCCIELHPYLWYETTFRVTFLSLTHHVLTYVRTHVHTYFVRIDPRFRASR